MTDPTSQDVSPPAPPEPRSQRNLSAKARRPPARRTGGDASRRTIYLPFGTAYITENSLGLAIHDSRVAPEEDWGRLVSERSLDTPYGHLRSSPTGVTIDTNPAKIGAANETFDLSEYETWGFETDSSSPSAGDDVERLEGLDADLPTTSEPAEAALHGLVRRQELIRRLEAESAELAQQAHMLGKSWGVIGDAVGLSRSGAQKRWDPEAKERNKVHQREYMARLRGEDQS